MARSENEAKEMLLEPSWRQAKKEDLTAWRKRLEDPAIAFLRAKPPITETEYDVHPEEAAKNARDAEARRKADEDAKEQAAAAQKVADAARAAAGGAAAKVEGDSQPGPSSATNNPGGIG